MKIRTGFVSNSSSSSFICDVSGAVESGWDLSLSEAGMYECKAGHTFCEDYLLNEAEFKAKYEDEESEFYDEDIRYIVPSEYCPICSLSSISDTDLLNYLLKKSYTNRDEVKKEITEKFKTLKELVDSLK
jgi:hypothetical protein